MNRKVFSEGAATWVWENMGENVSGQSLSQPHLFYKTLLPCCKTTSGTVFGPGPKYQYLWKGMFWRKALVRAIQNFQSKISVVKDFDLLKYI